MKNRSHIYHINGPRLWHRHKYTKYKMCLSVMNAIYIRQHLSNIWSSIYQKVKQQWGWVEERVAYKKSVQHFSRSVLDLSFSDVKKRKQISDATSIAWDLSFQLC